jgi:pimeloyl-ACP methyl ester carboxylesterase
MLGIEPILLSSFFILLMQNVEICRGAAPPAQPRATVAVAARGWTTHTYRWASRQTGREHAIRYATAGCGEPVLLCHGFGGNIDYWRAAMPPIAAEGFKVYAIDYLGFGCSDKPADASYSIELWTELTRDFMREFIQRPCALVGNSLGSLIALNTAATDDAGAVKALALLNCAGGMNSKFVVTESERAAWQRALLGLLFGLIDYVLLTPALRDRAFRAYSSEANVRKILESVYVDKARVDDELVRAILGPAADPAAAEVFARVLTGDPGTSPFEMVDSVRAPILAVWGDRDTFTPLDGPTGRLFTRLALERPDSAAMRVVEAGHAPHDDNPQAVINVLLPFLRTHLPRPVRGGSATGTGEAPQQEALDASPAP